MVAGRDLCTVVDAAFKSLAFNEERQFRCQLDDDEKQDNYADQASETQLDANGSNVISKPIIDNGKPQYVPILRSGSCTDIGQRRSMEDEHICIDDLSEDVGPEFEGPKPNAYYGVFDGHCGSDAATFVRNNLHKLFAKDHDFLQSMKRDFDFSTAAEKAVRNAFLVADLSLADNCDVDSSSGTTVLIALILGRSLLVANAGDCRAVLCRRGRAVEMSRDHKPDCFTERSRIEAQGGYVEDGYLNGELSVARALGDWDMKMSKGSLSPLSAEPEFRQTLLTEEDEFLIIGCDGIWDVMTSECAVSIARRELMRHNDPYQCSKELVREALRRNTRDNLTVVVICFSTEPPPPPPVVERPRHRYCNISAESLRNLRNLLQGV